METLGGWDSEAIDHLRGIAIQTATRSDRSRSVVVNHFFQRLAILLQRSNSALIAARAPPLPPPHIIGST